METSASFEAWSAPSSYPAIEPTSEAWETTERVRSGKTRPCNTNTLFNANSGFQQHSEVGQYRNVVVVSRPLSHHHPKVSPPEQAQGQ